MRACKIYLIFIRIFNGKSQIMVQPPFHTHKMSHNNRQKILLILFIISINIIISFPLIKTIKVFERSSRSYIDSTLGTKYAALPKNLYMSSPGRGGGGSTKLDKKLCKRISYLFVYLSYYYTISLLVALSTLNFLFLHNLFLYLSLSNKK
jgi:hypothetical protein